LLFSTFKQVYKYIYILLFLSSFCLLGKPEPELLENVPWNLLGPNLSVNGSLTGVEVDLAGLVGLGALDDLPSEEEDEEDGDTNVGGEEVGDVPLALAEDLEFAEDQDEAEVDERAPGEVRLERRLEHEGVAVNALRLKGLLEFDVGDGDAAPGEKIGGGDEAGEPEEDVAATIGDGHEGEKGDGGRDTDAVDGDTLLVALEEELRGLTALGQGVQVTGTSVAESVGRRRG